MTRCVLVSAFCASDLRPETLPLSFSLSRQIVEGVLLELYAGKRKPADEKSLVRYTALLKKWREDLHPDLVIGPHATISPPPNCVTLSYVELCFPR